MAGKWFFIIDLCDQ